MNKNIKRSLKLALTLGSLYSAPALAKDISEVEAPQSFDMTADNFSYGQNGAIVNASGNVKVISSQGSVWADEIIYNAKEASLKAEGNVVYVDANNVTMFTDSIELTDGLKKGVLNHLKVKLGDTETSPRFTAERAERLDEDRLSLTNMAYSSCANCATETDDDLPWRIRAGKVIYDDTQGHMTYNDAYLDVHGTPVMYLPWFRHPVREVAVNGILPPTFGSSTKNGFKVQSAYYHRISPYQDITTRFNYQTERGMQVQPEWRYNGTNLTSQIKASFVDDEKTGRLRSHFDSETEYLFETGERLGLVGQIASDDEYMDDFFEKTDAYLDTTLYYEKANETNYTSVSASRYQDLRNDANNEDTPHVIPRLTLEKLFYTGNDTSSYLMTKADFTSLSRSEGGAMNRLATEISYNKNHITHSGNRFTFNTSLRTDGYYLDAEEAEGTKDGFQGRIIPQMSLMWDRSYISPSGTHKLTPKAMLVLSPRGSNGDHLPNEDSLDYELDTTSLFKANRFSGYDMIESGSRFIYGIDNHWGTADDIQFRLFFGQSLNFNHDETVENASGTSSKQSDFVGFVEVDPYDWLNIRSNFLVDQASLEAEQMDNSLRIGYTDSSYLTMTHTFVEDGPEELNVKGAYEFNDTWSVESETRKDLEDEGRTLLTSGSIIYTQQCYKFSFKAARRGYESNDVEPATEYTFNIELLTFGE